MAEKIKDSEDRFLETMFESGPIADNEFSAGVMTRLKRHLWIRRLVLPIAFVFGGVIAIEPLSQLVVTFSKFLAIVPANFGFSFESIPEGSTIILGVLLLAAMAMVTRMLEE